jgi:hypothetical protein
VSEFDEGKILRLAPKILRSKDFQVISAAVQDHLLDLHFRIAGATDTFGAKVPLVRSTLPMPFLYMPPKNEKDILYMLLIWLDEETATGCIHWGFRRIVNGVPYFEIEPYGFRRADELEHVRLNASAVNGGWDNRDVAEGLRSPD